LIQSWTFWAVAVCACSVFWVLPVRMRAGFLALVSIGYLATLDAFSVAALAALATLFYVCAPWLAEGRPQRHRALIALILVAALFLGAFKYLPPLLRALSVASPIAMLLIPLGISYYCFKLIHFAIEASRGTLERGRIDTFFLYLFLFPIFTAGPIERYDHFVANRVDRLDREDLVQGLHRVVVGLIKQAVIADLLLRVLVQSVPDNDVLLERLPELSTPLTWLIVARNYLHVYISFSAYSDIAIGISRLFGLRIQENFNWPVFARSASDYWQRWHMTLSRWCQDYVYLPALGHTRNPYLALQMSFFVMGMWHAGTATRLLWGMYHATAVGLYTAWTRLRRRRKWNFLTQRYGFVAVIALTQLYVLGSWAILTGEDTGGVYQGLRVLAKLLFLNLAPPSM
jgi:alginate O-acetyltransferase complex protein AlgI